jgi:hypothetical protein
MDKSPLVTGGRDYRIPKLRVGFRTLHLGHHRRGRTIVKSTGPSAKHLKQRVLMRGEAVTIKRGHQRLFANRLAPKPLGLLRVPRWRRE